MLNTGRYDLGWYGGRVYAVVSASFLLIVLLNENIRHFARLIRMSLELTAANQELSTLSRQDGLTGLANRRHFDEYLAEQIAVANRYGRPLTLVICDVDHFKAYNDLNGHQAGDECLQQVAQALKSTCHRPGDLAARYGGEEFALILPDTDLDGAAVIAEAGRSAIAALMVRHGASLTAPVVSISCGVAAHCPHASLSQTNLIRQADRNLYHAKTLGRNRVISWVGEVG
jgi:diguanylate cyclase (GGDEF)-like protein